MSNETWLDKKLRDVVGAVEYETERLVIGINEQIVDQMIAQDMTRSALAERLGVDKAHVTRLLNGTPNMTLKTLVSVARALGCRVSIPSFIRLEQHAAKGSGVVKFAPAVHRLDMIADRPSVESETKTPEPRPPAEAKRPKRKRR